MVEKNSLKNHTRSLANKWVGILRTFELADNMCYFQLSEWSLESGVQAQFGTEWSQGKIQ